MEYNPLQYSPSPHSTPSPVLVEVWVLSLTIVAQWASFEIMVLLLWMIEVKVVVVMEQMVMTEIMVVVIEIMPMVWW